MEDTKKIKTIFSIDAMSIVADTEDEATGEASTGYQYTFNSSLPELAFALAGFLKVAEEDADIKTTLGAGSNLGDAFINLVKLYYDKAE